MTDIDIVDDELNDNAAACEDAANAGEAACDEVANDDEAACDDAADSDAACDVEQAEGADCLSSSVHIVSGEAGDVYADAHACASADDTEEAVEAEEVLAEEADEVDEVEEPLADENDGIEEAGDPEADEAPDEVDADEADEAVESDEAAEAAGSEADEPDEPEAETAAIDEADEDDSSAAPLAGASKASYAKHVDKDSAIKRLRNSTIILAALMLAAVMCTVILAQSRLSVPYNSFETGSVGISINGGAAIIDVDDFEPGYSVQRDFYIEATGSADGYVRLYFADVRGNLAPLLLMTLCERDTGATLYSGTPADFSAESAVDLGEAFSPGERRWYTVYFEMPTYVGNSGQGTLLSFNVQADITQARNNAEKAFE